MRGPAGEKLGTIVDLLADATAAYPRVVGLRVRTGFRGEVRRVEWADDYALVAVYFTPDGRVEEWMTFTADSDDRTWAERLRDRVRDLWR